MKRKALIAIGVIALIATSTAIAGKVRTFGTGDVTVTKWNIPEVGVVATIFNDDGEYAGVYADKPVPKKLDKVRLGFVSHADVAGGAPRWSIPIDTDGNRKTVEGYAFIDVISCGGYIVHNQPGPNEIVNVSTANPDCHVYFQSGVYDNWTAFVAANPTYQGAKDVAFAIADQPGQYQLYQVRFK